MEVFFALLFSVFVPIFALSSNVVVVCIHLYFVLQKIAHVPSVGILNMIPATQFIFLNSILSRHPTLGENLFPSSIHQVG